MGNVLSEWILRVSRTWKSEGAFSMLLAFCALFVDHQPTALHSFLVAMGAIVVALILCGLYHLVAILWKVRIITGLHVGDPVVIPRFIDERKEIIATPRSACLELKNIGAKEALWIRIAPVKLRRRVIYFRTVVDSLPPTDYARFHAEVGDQWGYDWTHDLVRAMSEEWKSYPDYETRREVTVPVRFDFEDVQGNRFECLFDLLYHGGKGLNQPASFSCMECKNIVYRRIVPGGFLPPAQEL